MASSGGDLSGLAAAALHASSDATGPEEIGHADDNNTISDDALEPPSFCPEQESNDASVSTKKKQPAWSKCKSVEELPREATATRFKTVDSKKLSSSNNNSLRLAAIQDLRKPLRKGSYPIQLRESVISEDKRPSTWICKPAKLWLPQKIHSVAGAYVVFVIFSMTAKTLAFSWSVHQRLVAAGIAVSWPAMLSPKGRAG